MAAGEYRFSTAPLDAVRLRDPLAALDRDVRGSARALDHAYFAENGHGVAFFLHDEFVGYAYVWRNGRIGPIAAASASYAVQFFGFALAALQAVYGATWCATLVPGTNVRTLRAALKAGLHAERTDALASDGASSELDRYVGFHPLLF